MEGVFIPFHLEIAVGTLKSRISGHLSRYSEPGFEESGLQQLSAPKHVSCRYSKRLFGYSAHFEKNQPKCHSECICVSRGFLLEVSSASISSTKGVGYTP